MAQTAPTPPDDAPRRLPRRAGVPSVRQSRPRFTPTDGLWIVVLALLSPAVCLTVAHTPALLSLGAATTTALVYLVGWRARDRAAGVVAALLLATSLAFARDLVSPEAVWFTVLTVAALFAFVGGSTLLALVAGAAAAITRPDGLLLGLLLLALAASQGRKDTGLGAALFFGLVVTGEATRALLMHHPLPPLSLGIDSTLLRWLLSPPALFVAWFLMPYCTEVSDAPRRARWTPVVLWAVIYFALHSLIHAGDATSVRLPFMPLLFLMAGGGLSRLLPTIAGELPNPALRYVLATLSVLALVGIRARTEWPHPAPPAAVPALLPVLPQSAPPRPQAVATPPTPRPAVIKHAAVPVVRHPAKPPAAPVVPAYIRKNGRLVKRTKWAIQWAKTHPQTGSPAAHP